ncbi:DNA methyltransferase [bacterium CPR1]|nr:DNA methyltransferase [bacterium CPR1]
MLEPQPHNRHSPSELVARLREVRSTTAMAGVQKAVEQLAHQVQGDCFLVSELKQIQASQTLERAHYYVDRLIKGLTVVRTPEVSDLNLNRWKEYTEIQTDSLWIIPRRDGTGVHKADYWGNFVPQIPQQMIQRYTRAGEWVLDPFCGSGTTPIEAQRLGRHTLGVELRADMVEHARGLIESEENPHSVTQVIVQGDSSRVDLAQELKTVGANSVQLAILHPPYFDIIQFSDNPDDLSRASDVTNFLQRLRAVVSNVSRVLDAGRYLVLVIGDKYAEGEWIPLGFQSMQEICNLGFSLKSIVVKNFEDTAGKRHQKELWRYRALAGGFYVFKHEYVFLFRKSTRKRGSR